MRCFGMMKYLKDHIFNPGELDEDLRSSSPNTKTSAKKKKQEDSEDEVESDADSALSSDEW